jgi:hypothetical protein
VFSDFKDASENLLETNLIRFAVDPADYLLKFIWFADGSQQSQCWGMTAAFTEPGSRVVFVCGRHFDQNSREAELQIIHEILHTLGLGENPPSSGAITKQVIARCGVSNSRPVSKARGSDAKTLGPTPTLDQRRKFEREIAAWIAVAGSQAKPQLAALPLTVAIHDSAALPPPVLERAKRAATEIYRRIGVSVTWLAGPLVADAVPTDPPACPDSATPLIRVRLVGRLPNADRPTDSLGFAVSGGTLASVLVKPVADLANRESLDVGDLLGVVMAHEIGHLLLPAISHSTGIMAARIDLSRISRGGPSFTQPHASIIRARLASMGGCEQGRARTSSNHGVHQEE